MASNINLEELKSKVANWEDDFPVMLLPVKMQIRFVNCLHLAKLTDLSIIANRQNVEGLLSEDTKTLLDQLTGRLNDTSQELPSELILPARESAPGTIGTFPQIGFRPIPDKKELWIRFNPDDIHVHTHEDDITLDEYESGVDFWREMQKATVIEDDASKKNQQVGAWRVLASGYGNSRAAWIARVMKPGNYDETGGVFPEDLEFNDPPGEEVSTWNVAPQSKVLPEYFVVRLYKKENQTRSNGDVVEVSVPVKTIVGAKIPDDIKLGVNPQDEGGLFQETNTGLEMPQSLKWLVDFDEAEEVGMAIRVALSDDEALNGFDQILAIGVRTNSDAANSQELVKELFTNHHYKPGGMSILPQGTITNNTETENSGKGLDDLSALESFDLEFGLNAFQSTDDPAQKCDGQRVVEAFHLDDEDFNTIYANNQKDISSAVKVNQVLWHATLGYSLPQYFFPIIDQSDVDHTCEFMVNYVLGRGFLPTLRIDDQPYGVLPITRYSNFEAGAEETNAAFVNQMHQNALTKLSLEWDKLVTEVKQLTKETPPNQIAETFYKILELQASSNNYDQQLAIGDMVIDGIGAQAGIDLVNPSQLDAIKTHFREKIGINLDNATNAFSYVYYPRVAPLIKAQLVDSLPPVEGQKIEGLAGTEKNYIEWMGAFSTTFDQLKGEDFSSFLGADLTNPPQSILYNLLRYALIRHYLLTAMRIKYANGSELRLGQAFSLDYQENLIFVSRDANNNNQIDTIALQDSFQSVLTSFLRKDRMNEIELEAFETHPENEELRNAFIQEKMATIDSDVEMGLQSVIIQEKNASDLWQDDKLAVLDYEITFNEQTVTIKEYIDNNINNENGIPENLQTLNSHKVYLQELAALPSGIWERLFNEHLDTGHYRIDAWLSGLANYRLDHLVRKNKEEDRKGIHIGAYSYLENVRPRTFFQGVCIKKIDNPELLDLGNEGLINPIFPNDAITNEAFNNDLLLNRAYVYLGDQSLVNRIGYDESAKEILSVPVSNPKNQGFIPAPSLVHAVTGAVLRNAYTSHKTSSGADDTFAINLSSSRVREAMYFLEGLENGQEMGALLGYKFERALREEDIFLSRFIYEFREKYPFVVQNINQANPDDPTDKLDSRIVVDGKQLVQAQRNGNTDLDDFLEFLIAGAPEGGGEPTINPPLSGKQKETILKIVDGLEFTLDSINDLLMAESFYQIAAGNPERSRSALKMLNDAGNIQMPEITKVPRTGFSLTHRVGVMLPNGGTAVEWGPFINPRGAMEPKLNRYLRTKLPEASKIVIRVSWTAGEDENGEPQKLFDNIPISKLPIQPIDLMYMYYHQRNSNNESELRYLVDNYARAINNLTDDQFIEIHEEDRTDFNANEVHLFALAPLLTGIAEMVNGARYIKPEDLMLPTDGERDQANQNFNWVDLRNRIQTVYLLIEDKYEDLIIRFAKLEEYIKLSEEEINADIVQIRLNIKRLRETLLFFASIGFRNAIPPLDRTINAINLERIYLQTKTVKKAFIERLGVLRSSGMILDSDLEVDVDGAIQIRPLRITDVRDFVVNPLLNKDSSRYFKDLSNEAIIEELLEVVKALMGRSFRVFPRFTVFNKQEFENARKHPSLLDYAGEFAVEEWIQSLAPVRPKMHSYFKLNMLTEMFDTSGADRLLQPLQLPYSEDGEDRWLGMEYPPEYDEIDVETNTRKINEDNLSVVLEYSDNFKVFSDYSGYVFDEWNEIVPFKEVSTGLSFNYDQPNSEAPNSILLAVPSQKSGNWTFEDLIGAVEETIELSKKRAVDPDIIKQSPLNQFLPAVFAAINQQGGTPSMDFGRVIKAVETGNDGAVFNKFTAITATQPQSLDIEALGVSDVFLDADLE